MKIIRYQYRQPRFFSDFSLYTLYIIIVKKRRCTSIEVHLAFHIMTFIIILCHPAEDDARDVDDAHAPRNPRVSRREPCERA